MSVATDRESSLTSSSPAASHVVRDATCLNCCCLCDDIVVEVSDNRITHVQNACELGRAWFQATRHDEQAVCTIGGQPVELDAAIEEAARLLTAAKNPLVYGLAETTSEAQRRAVSVADWLGATFDTATSSGHAPSIMGFQVAGKVTCTLGESRNRSDLIIFWGTNVAATQPRFFSRYSAEAPGMFVPRGRAGRTCVLIDIAPNETAQKVDLFFQIKPGGDFEVIWTLRALAKGVALDAETVLAQTGVPLARWVDLMERMKSAQYGAFCFGKGLMRTGAAHANCEGLFRLTREMNDHARFVARSIRARGNVTGADKVSVWRTGYPFGISLSRGYPRYNPGEYTAADVLARGEVDAALIVGGDPLTEFNEACGAHLRSIPLVVISSRETATFAAAHVAIPTATYGLHTSGTAYRMDDVPLALRPALTSQLPSELDVLIQLEERIRILQNNSAQ